MRTRRLLLIVLFAGCLAASGCRQDEHIESYEVPHPEREKIRLLAAIVPYRDSTWFVRLSGPEAAVEEQRKPFDEFVQSIRFDDKEDLPIRWTAPESWEQQKGKGMAAIAFRIPAKPQALQATLTSLGKFDEEMNTLAGNVNRWRKQLDLPPVEGPALEQVVKKATVDKQEIFIVDMTGVGVARKAGPAPPKGRDDPHAGLPLGPIGAARNAGTKGLPFRFEVPRGWEKQSKVSQFTSVAFLVPEGNDSARVTITPAGGDVLSNLKRWREGKDQAGLPPVSDTEIMRQAQEIQVAGVKATFADFASLPGGNNLRILGVILPLQGNTWFVKMTGPPDLVGRQKASFEAFVQSFKLDVE